MKLALRIIPSQEAADELLCVMIQIRAERIQGASCYLHCVVNAWRHSLADFPGSGLHSVHFNVASYHPFQAVVFLSAIYRMEYIFRDTLRL